MGVGKIGIGKTGVGKMGVGKMGTPRYNSSLHANDHYNIHVTEITGN